MATKNGEIAKSEVHENLDRAKIFDMCWLEYCCCYGMALGPLGDPLFGSEQRNLCIHQTCQCTDFGNPLCENISVNICLTSQCAFPPISGSPTCVCCSKKLAGTDGVSDWKPKLFDLELNFDAEGTYWLYYIFCGGLAAHKPLEGNRPIFGASVKQLCIKQQTKCVSPIQDGILCSGLGTQLCCWSQMQIPPAEGNPMIAICGWRMKNKKQGS